MRRKSEYYPPFKDQGEVIASWGEAQLIKYLDGKLVLKGGSKEDRQAAHEWISLSWHEAVGGAMTKGGGCDSGGLGSSRGLELNRVWLSKFTR
jgi:hypothetical protein